MLTILDKSVDNFKKWRYNEIVLVEQSKLQRSITMKVEKLAKLAQKYLQKEWGKLDFKYQFANNNTRIVGNNIYWCYALDTRRCGR